MKRRILSMVMLVVLLVGAIPFSASAITQIATVEVSGLNLPEANDPADFYVELSNGCSLDEVEWYDETAGEFLEIGEKLILNHAYTVTVYAEANNGYEFKYINSYTPDVAATIDGVLANVVKVYEYNAWAKIGISYSFSTCPNDWIESVEATVIPPVAGSPLVHSVTVPANANYEVQMVEPNNSTHYYRFYNGIQWNIEFQSGVLEGTTAQLGKWYCASVLLKPKAGYAFLENGNIKATINGKEAQINDPTSDANLLEFSYSGFETFGRIPAFNVSIAEPVVGEYPYFYANAEVANVAVDNNNLRWVDRTANKYMTAYDVFEAGHEYEIIFEIKTATGYRFMKDFDSSYVTVNNTAADVGSISATDDVIRVYKTYVIDSRTPVKNVVATANTQAILYDFGQYLTPRITVNEGDPAKIESIRWESYYPGAWDGDRWVGAQWESMPSSAQFRIDKNYRLVAQLRIDGAAGSTHYLYNPTVRINNDLWEVGPVTVESNYSYVWITSPTMVPAAYEDAQTFKVTFDSKGGSAVPAITGVYYAKSIARPADPVRSGYTFKGWYKDADCTVLFRFEGENGMNRIYEDCTLYAKWEAKAPSNPCANGHTYDNACDPDCNECGDIRTPADHTGGTATCKSKAICSVCGESYGELAEHTYANACDKDCNVCGFVREIAPEGWVYENNVWYFYKDGAVTTGWQYIGNTWYYFNQNGAMVTGWQNLGGTWYYFNQSGAMQTGWLLDGVWYYLADNGAMVDGWQYIGNTWYYFSGGAMQTGWLNQGGTWYYLADGGNMVTGWQNIGGTWYYFADGGAMQTGWVYSGVWYYLNDSGAMVTGWQNIGGTWYYFNAGGAMYTGWLLDGNTWYYLADGGNMVTDWQLIGGTWYYFNSSGAWVG